MTDRRLNSNTTGRLFSSNERRNGFKSATTNNIYSRISLDLEANP